MAGNLGSSANVVSDASATFDFTGLDGVRIPAETMHHVGLVELHDEFAAIRTTDQVMESLRR